MWDNNGCALAEGKHTQFNISLYCSSDYERSCVTFGRKWMPNIQPMNWNCAHYRRGKVPSYPPCDASSGGLNSQVNYTWQLHESLLPFCKVRTQQRAFLSSTWSRIFYIYYQCCRSQHPQYLLLPSFLSPWSCLALVMTSLRSPNKILLRLSYINDYLSFHIPCDLSFLCLLVALATFLHRNHLLFRRFSSIPFSGNQTNYWGFNNHAS